MLRVLSLSLALAVPAMISVAAPAAAQLVEVPYHDDQERTNVTGPYAPYTLHVLKHSARRYEVLFTPGFVDGPTAVRAVAPLCAATGRQAQAGGTKTPAVVTLGQDGSFVLQGYRVNCR